MEKFKIIEDEIYGYKRVEPIPSQEYLDKFYKDKYYEISKATNESINKLMIDDESIKNEELKWLQKTEYVAIDKFISSYLAREDKSILDIGSWTGDFLEYMNQNGWKTCGIEPSTEGFLKATKKNLEIYNENLDSFCKKTKVQFDAINMSNVLEHIPKPEKVLNLCKQILKKDGVIRIKVPNDFNKLQLIADKKFSLNKWWVSIPEHVNYFSFSSLKNLFESCGYKVIYQTTDFPMEMFLLQGDNYIKDKSLGKACHTKRVEFELNLDFELRKQIYDKLAEIEVGREIIMYAVLDSDR